MDMLNQPLQELMFGTVIGFTGSFVILRFGRSAILGGLGSFALTKLLEQRELIEPVNWQHLEQRVATSIASYLPYDLRQRSDDRAVITQFATYRSDLFSGLLVGLALALVVA